MILHTHELLAIGLTHADIRDDVRAGRLVRLRRGTYATVDEVGRRPEDRHRALVRAVAARNPGAVVSHVSAGVLLGLPVPWRTLDRVHLTRVAGRTGTLTGASVVLHRVVAAPGSTTVDGLAVTDLAQTTLDLCRTLRPSDGLAVADAALRRGADREALLAALAMGGRRPGNPRARRTLLLADGLAESAGESWSRWLMHDLGLPMPELQTVFRIEGGEVRADFFWRAAGVVGEFDGMVKYGRLLRPGQQVEDVIAQEKRREQGLRNLGLWVIRWTAKDLGDREGFRTMIARALEAGGR